MPLILLLLASLVVTYLTFKDAQARGMNAKAWSLLMLLTSGLGLPIYLLARKPKQA